MKKNTISTKSYTISFIDKNQKINKLYDFVLNDNSLITKLIFNTLESDATYKWTDLAALKTRFAEIKAAAPIDITIKVGPVIIDSLEEKAKIMEAIVISEHVVTRSVKGLSNDAVNILIEEEALRKNILDNFKNFSVSDCKELMKSFPKIFPVADNKANVKNVKVVQ